MLNKYRTKNGPTSTCVKMPSCFGGFTALRQQIRTTVFRNHWCCGFKGGPGASGTGFGNFYEIGPSDINGNKREYTWLKSANVLFVDNPVGAGFSYVTDDSAYTTNVTGLCHRREPHTVLYHSNSVF